MDQGSGTEPSSEKEAIGGVCFLPWPRQGRLPEQGSSAPSRHWNEKSHFLFHKPDRCLKNKQYQEKPNSDALT